MLASWASFAQSELTMPFMDNVYQGSYANPAAIPQYKVSIGLPGMSSVYAGFTNTGFSYRDMTEKRSDSDTTYLDFNKMIGGLKNKNYLYAGASVDLFSFRVKIRDYFVGISVSEQASLRFSYPKDLMGLVWNGTGDYIGKKADLRALGLDAVHYREYALHVAKQGRKWTFGGRAKYLTGLSNVHTQAKKLGLSVDGDMYDLTFASDATLNTSGVPIDSSGNFTGNGAGFARDYMMNFRNSGFALDAGVSYKFNSKWTFSFFFNNLGFIRWKDQVKNYNVKGGTAFSGFDAGRYYFNDSIQNFNNYIDTLGKSYNYQETSNKYTTSLMPHFYLSAKYKLGKNTEAIGSLYFEKYKKIRPALTLALSQKAGRVLNVIVSYSMQYGKFNNLGLGLMVKPGPLQIYAVSDNLVAALNPATAKSVNVRCGMNLVFGRIREEDKQSYKVK